MKAIIIYWSKTGNTEKVALTIQESLQETEMSVLLKKVEDAGEIDFFAYDLICLGFPSYRWRPPKPVDEFLNSTFRAHRKEGRVKVNAPKLSTKMPSYSAPIPVPTRAFARPYRQGCMPASSSNISDSRYWMSCT